MKQHCCCTWQGHPWLAISTVVAAEIAPKIMLFHVGYVSCRVTLWGEFVDPNEMKDREAVVSGWVCGFMLGLERILWCFSCCFVSGLCLWCLVHWNSLLWKRQNTTSFSAFSAMAWTEQNTLFHVGLGFRVGFVGAQIGALFGGEVFLLTVGAFLLTVKLLCSQSLRALVRRTFPLKAKKLQLWVNKLKLKVKRLQLWAKKVKLSTVSKKAQLWVGSFQL